MSTWEQLQQNIAEVHDRLDLHKDYIHIELLRKKHDSFVKGDFEWVALSVICDLVEEITRLKETELSPLPDAFRDRP